jgi:hypothetical protein
MYSTVILGLESLMAHGGVSHAEKIRRSSQLAPTFVGHLTADEVEYQRSSLP